MAVHHVYGAPGCDWLGSIDIMVLAIVQNAATACLTVLNIENVFLFSVIVYYLRSKSKARIKMVKLLRQMLQTEAKDKAFLLANITRVSQNNGMCIRTVCGAIVVMMQNY